MQSDTNLMKYILLGKSCSVLYTQAQFHKTLEKLHTAKILTGNTLTLSTLQAVHCRLNVSWFVL